MPCECEFDPECADADEESTHFKRVCRHCGESWCGLHCPHDGVQNPCPQCGERPTPERDRACVFEANKATASPRENRANVRRCKCNLCRDVRAAFVHGEIPPGGVLLSIERTDAFLWQG